ncbi:hypothetical protein ACFPL7_23250 [Dongia soli]|uniref:Uncharacterized protein n=1 Tax=Dongia soli TaxID=600628 RepID=A0ABU5EHU0_9PROT|nr:hypothetical protein [Dongia soli]MDY0885887.1 hypothetical protein [Dongia soli]
MKHQTLDQLRTVAEISADQARPALSRHERLERWAQLLERKPYRILATFYQTEYQTRDARGLMRSADSPISVAFEDPVLRAQGLFDDSYDQAKQFFGLTDRQLHDIVCYCHYGATMTAAAAAQYVRAAMAEPEGGLFARIKAATFWFARC